jgi:hypothetical protein
MCCGGARPGTLTRPTAEQVTSVDGKAARTLLLRVYGAASPCPRCGCHMLWVLGLHPIHRPQVGELVTLQVGWSRGGATVVMLAAQASRIAKPNQRTVAQPRRCRWREPS